MAGKRPRLEQPSPCAATKGPMWQIETLAEASQHQEVEDDPKKINIAINANLLQCYLCSGSLTPPLSQCTEGHVSCSVCTCCTNGNADDDDGEVKCLMCRKPETVTRCLAVEHVLAGVHVPCPFRQHGCTEMVPYASEQAHRASCAHAPRHCPISGCAGYAGKPLREHVQQDHPFVVRTVISPRCLTPLWMRTHEQARGVRLSNGDRDDDDGDEFLLVVGDYKQLGRALSVVRLVDESLDDKDFKHRIEVVGKGGVLSMTGETVDAERLEEPYEANPFLFIPNEIWDSSGYFRVFIELK